MSNRFYLRTSRVTLDVPYFLVGVSLSLGNEIGAEHQTRSCCRMKKFILVLVYLHNYTAYIILICTYYIYIYV